ncbi:cap-specific mRNA (nucleoside-2'-O-)-methyltransferase 2-like isoform X2 [Daphnia pulicaria]|uniref:cap-specific mRNA (nucleoside-2'-O-)-methyltransferase 2-like isoform X2 n=1 Tax=Daphnia pulicaria TaxID=35523 RepID=UPI001EE9DCD2|nr:cap-specific mRNA (nucleoside-2'-O-)-methyltransferase 2-like isoform X2 [Daphnia pulicaria]
MEAEIELHFLKKFQFKQLVQSSWSCRNPFGNCSWKIPELESLKYHLNCTKGLLSHMEASTWHDHTNYTNHAADIFHKVKCDINPELLTQAWLKFYECLAQFDLVGELPQHSSVFQSVHLCEAPGAFITSLNHFLQLRYPFLELKWSAITLNPYYEGNFRKSMIGDDRFISSTLKHWNFGFDDTGNIMEWCNVKAMLKKPHHQVTADGSVDCADNPGEQENYLAPLHWCETISALLILSNGGSFILKMFTLFEHTSVSLLYLLMMSFEELHVFKPCTSKEGNSEVYIIALRYIKTEHVDNLLRIIQLQVYERKTDVSLNALFSLDEIPEAFLHDIISCATLFKKHQEHAILRNLTLYNIPFEEKELEIIKKKIAYRYMQKYCLQRIPLSKQIVTTKIQKLTFLDIQLGRIKRHNIMSSFFNLNEVLHLQSELIEINDLLENLKIRKWINVEKEDWQQNIKYIHGKSYDILRNSKFCHEHIFYVFESIANTSSEPKFNSSFCNALLQREQTSLLNTFLDSSSTIREGEDFELKKPVLSRFAVATVWIMSLLFSQIECHVKDEPILRFVGYKEVPEIMKWMRVLDQELLNFVDISTLCRGSFSDLILLYNTKLLLQFSLSSTSTMSAY